VLQRHAHTHFSGLNEGLTSAGIRGIVDRMSDEQRRLRAAARRANPAGNPIRSFRMSEEPLLDERQVSTVDERVQEGLRLSYEAFRISGQEWPSYARAEMPGRTFRR
jgi:hypothetical protein